MIHIHDHQRNLTTLLDHTNSRGWLDKFGFSPFYNFSSNWKILYGSKLKNPFIHSLLTMCSDLGFAMDINYIINFSGTPSQMNPPLSIPDQSQDIEDNFEEDFFRLSVRLQNDEGGETTPDSHNYKPFFSSSTESSWSSNSNEEFRKQLFSDNDKGWHSVSTTPAEGGKFFFSSFPEPPRRHKLAKGLKSISSLNFKTSSVISDSTIKGRLELSNANLWKEFNQVNTEMIITKAGRCLFPVLDLFPQDLDPYSEYSFVIDFEQVSDFRYRFQKGKWISIGLDKRKFATGGSGRPLKPGVVKGRPYIHPSSPQSGKTKIGKSRNNFRRYLKPRHLHFKLTNRSQMPNNVKLNKPFRRCVSVPGKLKISLPDGYFFLTSFHKYQPRIYMINHSKNVPYDDKTSSFTFDDTVFIAVTHYQNEEVIKLKKNNNPHAHNKGAKKPKKDPLKKGDNNEDEETEEDINESSFEDGSDEVDETWNDFYTESIRSQFSPKYLEEDEEEEFHDIFEDRKHETDEREIPTSETSSNDDFHRRIRPAFWRGAQLNANKFYGEEQVKNINTIQPRNCEKNGFINIDKESFESPKFLNPAPLGTLNGVLVGKTIKRPRKISLPSLKILKSTLDSPSFSANQEAILNQESTFSSSPHTPHTPHTPRTPRTPRTPQRSDPFLPLNFFLEFNDTTTTTTTTTTPSTPGGYFLPKRTSKETGRLESENEKLREFIRQRYGVCAEKEADAIIALGSKLEKS
ncbi:hypothetical protein G9A89_019462 [Geosiphon pyriformis]|nr:hypothetical protein G9A89_019462 [Geosiphon pyriformis]